MILLEKGYAPQQGAGAHSQPTAWGGGWREGRGRLAPHRRQLNRDEDHCSRGSALSREGEGDWTAVPEEAPTTLTSFYWFQELLSTRVSLTYSTV